MNGADDSTVVVKAAVWNKDGVSNGTSRLLCGDPPAL